MLLLGVNELAMSIVYLGLGSNLGDRKQNLAQALQLISQQVVVQKISSIYETEPVDYREQPLFLNAVCRISTRLNPKELLRLVKGIEVRMGRTPSFANAPRIIDIDILFFDDEVISTQELTIPHPRLAGRAFVLVPLAEIAPDLVHPVIGKTAKELLDSLGRVAGIHKWAEAREIVNRGQNVSRVC